MRRKQDKGGGTRTATVDGKPARRPRRRINQRSLLQNRGESIRKVRMQKEMLYKNKKGRRERRKDGGSE